jgi:hypothetical protein
VFEPGYSQTTSGPEADPSGAIIGVAAHITAASPEGARYDPSLPPEQRRAADNGIWLSRTMRNWSTMTRCGRPIGHSQSSRANALVQNITHNSTKRYVLSEQFAQYLGAP